MRRIIGLTGLAGSGKSTVAKLLESYGYDIVKFASPLKNMLRAYLVTLGVDGDTIERMIEGDLKEVPSQLLAGRTPRHAMQTLGTEWGRNAMSKTFWVDAWSSTAAGHERIVCDDCRFPNEIDTLREQGAVIVNIVRPDAQTSAGNHASEHVPEFCHYRLNNVASVRELEEGARAILEDLDWTR